jgi:hypothetical protein
MSTVNILKTTVSNAGADIAVQLEYEILFNDSETRLDLGFVVVVILTPSTEMAAFQQGGLQVTRTAIVRPGGHSRIARSEAFTAPKASLFASNIDAASLFDNTGAGLDVRVEVTPEPCASRTSVVNQRLPTSTQPTMALQFDGVDNYIESHSWTLPFGNAFTVEMWARGGPQEGSLFYVTTADRSMRKVSAHLPYSDGNVYFDKGGDAAGKIDRINKKLESTDTADTWNHWAFVREYATGRMSIYKNGALWHEVASGLIRATAGSQYLMIGAKADGTGRYRGAISEFRVWHTARTAAQIKDNMNRRIPAGDSGLSISYALDKDSTTITDRSGANCHGGLRGSPVLVPGPSALITAGTSPTASTPSVDTTDDQKGTVTARGENGSGEAKERLFDNQRDSKWLDFSPQGSWVQYSYAPGIAGRLTGYTLTSAGDAPERDPADWQLQGSNDGGSSWVTVDTRTGVTFAERHQKQAFTVSGSPTYKAYRLNITKVLDASRANCVQLAEFELLGQQVSA